MYSKNPLFKFIIIGESSVGKTCIIMRYTEDRFTDSFLTTVGVDFKVKEVSVDGQLVKLQVWDTAGQEQFHTITKSYFRGAHGILLCFDVGKLETFEKTHMWMDSIHESAAENVDVVLIGNKNDIPPDKRAVSSEEGNKLAEEYNIPYFETSAKTGEGISEAFDALIRIVMSRKVSEPPEKTKHIKIDHVDEPKKKSSCCH
ncbi:hypothetical protein M9Y10_023049 [Tritrichomonas musculus]|uniref:Uncharacterized protein n=1 Tax=Tritrichomonas musculus TaxID=1915356 RepID=A0ABR2KUL2_9EUKA